MNLRKLIGRLFRAAAPAPPEAIKWTEAEINSGIWNQPYRLCSGVNVRAVRRRHDDPDDLVMLMNESCNEEAFLTFTTAEGYTIHRCVKHGRQYESQLAARKAEQQ